jgi:hypothetical protein
MSEVFPAMILRKDLHLFKCKRHLSFLDFSLLQEQQALHYELHKNIALQCHITLEQADQIHDAKTRIAELEKMLEEAQGMSPNTPSLRRASDFQFFLINLLL